MHGPLSSIQIHKIIYICHGNVSSAVGAGEPRGQADGDA